MNTKSSYFTKYVPRYKHIFCKPWNIKAVSLLFFKIMSKAAQCEPQCEKTTLWCFGSSLSQTGLAVTEEGSISFKFRIQEEEGSYYPSSKKKVTNQLCSSCVFVLA